MRPVSVLSRLLMLVMLMVLVVSVSATCPPCPAPPVHACCKVDVQVEGTCCQVRGGVVGVVSSEGVVGVVRSEGVVGVVHHFSSVNTILKQPRCSQLLHI